MEFIGRPNFGPASSLWSKAIDLASQRSNPMFNAIQEGMGQAQQGMGMMASAFGAQDERKHQEDMQTRNFQQAQEQLYKAHVADAGIGGRLAGPVGGQNMVESRQAEGQTPYLPGKEPKAGPTYEIGKASPTSFDLKSQDAGARPAGATITTHELAAMMGVKPQGPNMWMKAPDSEMDTWIRKFQITHGAGKQDQIDADTRAIFKDTLTNNPDLQMAIAKDPSLGAKYFAAIRDSVSGAVKGTNKGEFPNPPAEPVPESGPGFLDNLMMSGSLLAQDAWAKIKGQNQVKPAAPKAATPPQRTISRTDAAGNKEWGPADKMAKDGRISPATGKPWAEGEVATTKEGTFILRGGKWVKLNQVAKRG